MRHTANQRMKDKGVPEDWRSAYLGHENDSVNNLTYGDAVPAKVLFDNVIPALKFDEVDWDAIQYQSNPKLLEHLVAVAVRRDQRKEAKEKDKNIR